MKRSTKPVPAVDREAHGIVAAPVCGLPDIKLLAEVVFWFHWTSGGPDTDANSTWQMVPRTKAETATRPSRHC